MKIKSVKARQILDSRGNPTVEAEVFVESKSEEVKSKSYGVSGGFIIGRASVPSGASTGEHEAVELRDGEMVHFWGKGVMKAVENVEEVIGPALKGMEVTEQRAIDEKMIELDGTENKSKLGANAILAVSLACARAAAEAENIQLYEYLSRFTNNDLGFKKEALSGWKLGGYRLPVPFMNVINGGKHAQDGVDFQEFMLVPHGFESFSEALESADEVFMKLKEKLHKDGYSTSVGDEGGFAPSFNKNDQALEYLVEAIKEAGFKSGEEISLAMDPAMSELYIKNNESGIMNYELKTETRKLSTEEMIGYWEELLERFPIVSLEDGLDENDWEGWTKLNNKFQITNNKQIRNPNIEIRNKFEFQNSKQKSQKSEVRSQKIIQLVGDDFLVTNKKRLQRAIDEQACNAILIKLNQIGSLTETLDVINLAHENGFRCMVSHRSGETEDTFIADLAVGMGTGQIKAGSLSRSDRVAKYNRLLRIEEYLKHIG